MDINKFHTNPMSLPKRLYKFCCDACHFRNILIIFSSYRWQFEKEIQIIKESCKKNLTSPAFSSMLNGLGEENMHPVLMSLYREQILIQLLIPFQI